MADPDGAVAPGLGSTTGGRTGKAEGSRGGGSNKIQEASGVSRAHGPECSRGSPAAGMLARRIGKNRSRLLAVVPESGVSAMAPVELMRHRPMNFAGRFQSSIVRFSAPSTTGNMRAQHLWVGWSSAAAVWRWITQALAGNRVQRILESRIAPDPPIASQAPVRRRLHHRTSRAVADCVWSRHAPRPRQSSSRDTTTLQSCIKTAASSVKSRMVFAEKPRGDPQYPRAAVAARRPQLAVLVSAKYERPSAAWVASDRHAGDRSSRHRLNPSPAFASSPSRHNFVGQQVRRRGPLLPGPAEYRMWAHPVESERGTPARLLSWRGSWSHCAARVQCSSSSDAWISVRHGTDHASDHFAAYVGDAERLFMLMNGPENCARWWSSLSRRRAG